MTHDCRDAAHLYADLGIAVLQLLPCSKNPPHGGHGVYDATTDHDAIERFDPRGNLAMRCGAVSGIVAVDIDPRNGGRESFVQLEAERGTLPLGPVQDSGRGDGGHHRFLRYPECGVRSCDLAAGIELLSDGKYVLCWPSVHPETGGVYMHRATASLFTTALPDMPTWLIDMSGRGGPRNYGPPTGPVSKCFLGVAFAAAGWIGFEMQHSGKIAVRCPWTETHGVHDGIRRGDGRDSSACILPPTAQTPLGAFKCRHASCESRRTADVLMVLPDHAVRAAAAAHPELFVMARRMVHRRAAA